MSLNLQSIPENVERCNKIKLFLENQDDGATLTWLDLETATGVPMRAHAVKGVSGRPMVWRMLKVLRRTYESIPSVGIRLSAPETAVAITQGKVSRVLSGIRGVSKSAAINLERHGEKLHSKDRDKLTRTAATFETIKMLASETRHTLRLAK